MEPRDFANRFSAALRRGLTANGSRSITAAAFAREFNLRAGSLGPISDETARRWLRGDAMPELPRMAVLINWLRIDPVALFAGTARLQVESQRHAELQHHAELQRPAEPQRGTEPLRRASDRVPRDEHRGRSEPPEREGHVLREEPSVRDWHAAADDEMTRQLAVRLGRLGARERSALRQFAELLADLDESSSNRGPRGGGRRD